MLSTLTNRGKRCLLAAVQRRSRNFLLAAAILTFAVAAPIIILYARGYYIDTDRGEVVSTGMALIDTNVPRLEVSVDGEDPSTESNPVAVRGLLPGRHTIQLEREGFAPWSAELEVRAEQVTRVDDVVMVRSQPAESALAAGPVGAFAASPNGAYVAYVVSQGSDAGVWLHTVNDGDEDRRLIDNDGLAEDVAVGSLDLLRWSPDGKAVLLHAGARWWLLAPHVAVPVAEPLAHLDHVPPPQVAVDPSEASTVFWRDDAGTVWRWRTAAADSSPEALAAAVADFAVAPPKLFLVSATDGSVQLQTLDLRSSTATATDVASFSGSPQDLELLVAQGGGQVAVRANGNLQVLQRIEGELAFAPVDAETGTVQDAAWSSDGELLAYRRGSELWAYDVQPLGDDAPSFLVTRLADAPESLRWYPDGRHLVVQRSATTGVSVELLHMSRTAPQLQPLTTLPATDQSVPSIGFARRGADLLFVDTAAAGRPLVAAAVTLGPGD